MRVGETVRGDADLADRGGFGGSSARCKILDEGADLHPFAAA